MTRNLLSLLLAALLAAPPLQAEPRRDPETGALEWRTQAHGVTVLLKQITPDAARAFYLNRGFPAAAAERYAMACVFMAVLRNDAAPGELTFRLEDWRIKTASREAAPPSVAAWMAQWNEMGLADAAKIAFRWAQFPPDQEYAVGEWNQGMLAAGSPADGRFHLIARWTVAGRSYQGVLEDVVCAR